MLEKKTYNWEVLRKMMVENQILSRGIDNPRILEAFLAVPREKFVPEKERKYAYDDHPLPIGEGQTISQPFIVAMMTQLLLPQEGEKVLEVGTGSGYQSAILAHLGCEVFSMERIAKLAERARETLESLGYRIKIRIGDGTEGWQEYAPFDKIIVTAAAQRIPQPLLAQLKVGGRLVIPVGSPFYQELTVVEKILEDKYNQTSAGGCIFVPLIGKYS